MIRIIFESIGSFGRASQHLFILLMAKTVIVSCGQGRAFLSFFDKGGPSNVMHCHSRVPISDFLRTSRFRNQINPLSTDIMIFSQNYNANKFRLTDICLVYSDNSSAWHILVHGPII